MITLLTGAPGAGKTALLVEWLRTLYKDRPLYVHGLNGLTLEHTEVDAARWHLDLPDGAILVVDEVQKVWRPRGPGHAAPESVQALEVHRHRGIDVFLTTQKPNLLDSNVRGLVGRHVHIRDTGWLGRYLYEWPEVSENLAWKTCPLKKRYTLPKKAFEFYKSSTMHTKVAKGQSLMPFITAVLIAAALVLVWMVYRAIAGHSKPVVHAPVAASAPEGAFPVRAVSSASAPGARWPVYDAEPVRNRPEPLEGRAVQLEGGYTMGKQVVAYFGLLVDGQRVATVSLRDLAKMGYAYTEFGPCVGSLRYKEVERLVTCGKGSAATEERPRALAAPDAAKAPIGAQVAGAIF